MYESPIRWERLEAFFFHGYKLVEYCTSEKAWCINQRKYIKLNLQAESRDLPSGRVDKQWDQAKIVA